MAVFYALLFTLIAGVINGSYALFTKYVKKWPFENTWMVFSLFTFFLGPWLFLLSLNSHAWQVYQIVPSSMLTRLVIGGVLFGCGQIGFAMALDAIGMGLAFVINISLSTALGPMLPLFFVHGRHPLHADTIFTVLGIVVIIVGLLVSYFAGKRRDRNMSSLSASKTRYALGVLAAVVAGLGSAGQNFTFASTALMQASALKLGLSPLASSFIIWPGFLTIACVPYALYMLVLNIKNRSFHAYATGEKRFYFFAIIMAVFWFGSLVFYSKATQLIGSLGPVVIWPLFMSLIILTSNFWGWRYGEWANADRHAKKMSILGVMLFVVAVVIFGYAAAISQGITGV